jgi:hypothetical protein
VQATTSECTSCRDQSRRLILIRVIKQERERKISRHERFNLAPLHLVNYELENSHAERQVGRHSRISMEMSAKSSVSLFKERHARERL